MDLPSLDRLAQCRATLCINANAPKDDGNAFDQRAAGLGPSSLRHTLFEYFQRSDEKTGDLPCLYRVSQDFHKQGLTGERLLSGVTGKHELSKPVAGMVQYMGEFRASRSLFVNAKLFKEFLRGGSDGPCRDYDITKSFSRSRATRGRGYGLPIDVIEEWIQRPEAFAAGCGISVEQCKSFVTAAPTSGAPFAATWLNQTSLATIPLLLQRYKEQVLSVGAADATHHGSIVQAYIKMGCNAREAQVKTSYQLDCTHEWKLLQQGMAKVAAVAQVRALELDGIVVTPLSGGATVDFELLIQAKLDEV